MSKNFIRVPKYRHHTAKGLAVVTINGKHHYLGPYDSEASHHKYRRLVAEWLSSQGDSGLAPDPNEVAGFWGIFNLIEAYLAVARVYYSDSAGRSGQHLSGRIVSNDLNHDKERAESQMTPTNAFESRLKLRTDSASTEWQLWERKTLNIHRGVLHWRPGGNLTYAEMATEIRRTIKEKFKVSWWRGFGFGVLIEAGTMPSDIASLESSVDARASSKGTWQWTVFACQPAKIAVGVHTWTEGYLSPVFRDLLAGNESQGWAVGRFKKEKDALMKFLVAAARLKGFQPREFEP